MDKRCGTLPYVAPEILVRPYSATAADIWSCGIVLVAMLSGGKPKFFTFYRFSIVFSIFCISLIQNLTFTTIKKKTFEYFIRLLCVCFFKVFAFILLPYLHRHFHIHIPMPFKTERNCFYFKINNNCDIEMEKV